MKNIEGDQGNLPSGDRTPKNWHFQGDSLIELCVKKPVRKILYPPYLRAVSLLLKKRYGSSCSLEADSWLWGQRGNDYNRLRCKVNDICKISGKSILVIGCGTGRDIPSWLSFNPEKIVGVDYFNYNRAWTVLTEMHKSHKSSNLDFFQGDVENLINIEPESFDIISSDAVFEHVKDIALVLREMSRILVPGGVLYATFGPLWHSWGGDHLSGFDIERNGYNHLLYSMQEYNEYLNSFGEFEHSENDGRTWIRNGLFSYLRPAEYINALECAGFEQEHTTLILEPRGVRLLKQNPDVCKKLMENNSELDLIVTGMTIIFKKRKNVLSCSSSEREECR